LDEELIARGLFQGQAQARHAIEQRLVLVDGAPAGGAATLVGKSARITFPQPSRFVSRGGDKLEGALDDLGIDVAGAVCLDAGAGSGGFTDCLLQRQADSVVAIDVGYGQFDWSLRGDSRVTLWERTNIRELDPAVHGGPFDLVVADLSFIGLRQVLQPLSAAAASTGSLLVMVKPQFEAPRADVGPKGIVRDPAVWLSVLKSVVQSLGDAGLSTVGASASRLKGTKGNQEFFLHARRDQPASPEAIFNAVERASGQSA